METIEERYTSVREELAKINSEILDGRLYIDGCSNPRRVNKKDIEALNRALLLLWDMKSKYAKDYDGRAVLGSQIADLVFDMQRLMGKVEGLVKSARSNYEPAEELFVGSCEKIMRIFFNAQGSEEFEIKEFMVEGFGSQESRHGTREDQEFGGKVIVLGDAEALSQISNERVYWAVDLGRIIEDLAKRDKSLIVATNYYYESNVLPSYTRSSFDIKGRDHIRCCLKNDIMKKVVERFLEYAQSEGNHINDIPEEEILNRISFVSPMTIKPVKPKI